MESWLQFEALGAYSLGFCLVGVVILFIGQKFIFTALDPREPPEVKPTIPFVGHLFPFLVSQAGYLKELSLNVPFPIYTIRILGFRLYVINSPAHIQKVLGNPKAFDFDLFVIGAAEKIIQMNEAEVKLFGDVPSGGGPSYLSSLHTLVNSSLAQGPVLAGMNSKIETRMAIDLNNIGSQPVPTQLHRWIRNTLTKGICSSLYGDDNPIENDTSLIDSLWAVDTDFTLLLLPFPSVVAKKAFQGRARLNVAFRKYYSAGHWQKGAPLIRNRMALAKKYGFSEKTIADFEWSILYTAVTSAVPVAFWLLNYILSDPELVSSLRKEIEVLVSWKVVDGIKTLEIDPSAIPRSCPLLVSTWEETLRMATAPIAIRKVTKDIMFNDYLLKENSIIQMPGSVTHTSNSIWGPDAAQVKPQRFIKEERTKEDEEQREHRKLQNQAYFPFGGGRNLCPGRHLAFTEILGFASMVLYAFTIENKDGTPFQVKKPQRQKQGAAVRKPEGDIDIMITRRKEFEGVKLAISSTSQPS